MTNDATQNDAADSNCSNGAEQLAWGWWNDPRLDGITRGYTATKHQREVGTGYFDTISTALNPNVSRLALVGSTKEGQFH